MAPGRGGPAVRPFLLSPAIREAIGFPWGEVKRTLGGGGDKMNMSPTASSYGELVTGRAPLAVYSYCPVVPEACGREKPQVPVRRWRHSPKVPQLLSPGPGGPGVQH